MILYHGSNFIKLNRDNKTREQLHEYDILWHRESTEIPEETMSDARVTFMIEELVKEMALRLMEERHLTMKQALDTVYNSDTYAKVLDERIGLFSQSTAYVYSILETEMLTGKIG